MGSQADELHAVTRGQSKINLKIIVMQKMILIKLQLTN